MRRLLRPAVARSPRRPAARAVLPEPLESRTLFAAGDLDPTFGPGGSDGNGIVTTNITGTDVGNTVIIQTDNKILVGGSAEPLSATGADFALVRYNPDGSLDTTFGGGDGIVTTDFGSADVINALALTSDGHIVAVGRTGTGSGVNWAIARYNPDGTLDATFSPGGDDGSGKFVAEFFARADTASGVAIDSSGRILVTGTATGQTTQLVVARLTTAGEFDASFDSDGKAFFDFFEGADEGYAVRVQSDNQIVVAGASAPPGGYRRFVMLRLNPDGSPDFSFGDGGKASADFGGTSVAKDLVILPAGAGYVLGGVVDAPGGSLDPEYAVTRFTNAGTLDTSFGAGGRSVATGVTGDANAGYGLVRQSDGKLVLGGFYLGDGSAAQVGFGMVRFNPNGGVDNTFGAGGVVRTTVPGASSTTGADLALQADGKLVMAGSAVMPATDSDFAVARYVNNATVPGSISGAVFEDLNANGVRDAGEAGLAGVTVFQDVNNNGTFESGNATFSSTDVPKLIPDNGPAVTSNLAVAGMLGEVADVNVTLRIDHTYDPDLTVTLISPAGTRVLLFSDVGNPPGPTANFNNTTLDDQAGNSITGGTPPFSNTYRPMEPLSRFVGENANGTWKLELRDTAADDVGTLRAWSITLVSGGEASAVTDSSGNYTFADVVPGTYTIRAVPPTGYSQTAPTSGAHVITLVEGQQVSGRDFGFFNGTVTTTVTGRKAFYNNSAFDGRNPAPTAADLAAVATDKQALRPGGVGSFANVTSYARGINGIVVEFARLAPAATLTAADFQFRSGNTADPATWAPAPAPAQVVMFRSPIPEEPARVLITWPDGAIRNTWLEVTTLANANTGLSAPDVFYFGNLAGETGDQPSLPAKVTMRDEVAVRQALRPRGAAVTSRFDFDRDGDVDGLDLLTVRRNYQKQLTALAVPIPGAAALAVARVWSEQAIAVL